jgi:PAS domain-containing protein
MEELALKLDMLQDRLSLAIEAAGIGIWDWDIASGRLVWDLQMHAIFGTSPLTWKGDYSAFANCLHEDDLDNVGDAVRRSMVDRIPYHYEFRLTTVPGRVVFGGGKFYYNSRGLPERAIGVCLIKPPIAAKEGKTVSMVMAA